MENTNNPEINECLKIIPELMLKSHQLFFQQFLSQQDKETSNFINKIISSYYEIFQKILFKYPETIPKFQYELWQSNITSSTEVQESSSEALFDKRFINTDWQQNPIYNMIQKNYSNFSSKFQDLIDNITENEEAISAKKIKFFAKQLINAVSPTNFFQTNPEIFQEISSTGGENFLKGCQKFLHDIESGKNLLNIQTTDTDYFKLGENIAITAGKVIYQNELMQLIQYDPATKKVYENPLLIIPPWINKYYILDLQPKNSLVKWLVDQGHTVFLISWVNPARQHADKEFSDYLLQGPIEALKIIEQSTQATKINTLGYCVGGTLLSCALAYQEKLNPKNNPINSATFLTTLLDFSDPGELGVFIDEEQLDSLTKHMEKKGYLEGQIMTAVFNALRANDLIWANFINNYLLGKHPAPFDLLYWNSDPTNIPAKVHQFYLSEMYLNNNLVKHAHITLAEVKIDLSKIKTPSYFLAAKSDHIVPWESSYKGMLALSSSLKSPSKRFVLSASGHVAGVVNPPDYNKYCYWTYDKPIKNPQLWLEKAEQHNGSWWRDWGKWLKNYSGELISIEKLAQKKFKPLEKAPGSYVKMSVFA